MSVDHSGHRQRLKRALSENGLMSFSPHEVIELMLYTALPRRDVNELAHKIDDAFGGVSGLLRAKTEEMTALGLSENTARTLRAYADCVEAYSDSFGAPGVYVTNRRELDALARRVCGGGRCALTLLSSGRELIYTAPMPPGDSVRFVYEKALIYDAAFALVLCAGDAAPSREEISETKRALGLIDVEFDVYTFELTGGD